MGHGNFPYGAPDFNDTTQLEYSTTVSGVLTADEVYRISSDADVMIGFGEMHDEGFTMANGSFLGADKEMFVKTTANSRVVWATAPILTTSGICTITRLK